MRDRADELSILKEWTAAHPLYDSACKLNQFWICNFQYQILAILILRIKLQNLNRIIPAFSGNCASDHGFAGMNFICCGNFHRFLSKERTLLILFDSSVNSTCEILGNLTDWIS